MTREEVRAYALTFPEVYAERPFRDPNWELVRLRQNRKAFLWIFEREDGLYLDVRPDRRWRDFWREAFPGVTPSLHLNREHWNSIRLDGSIPEAEVKKMIAESYDALTDTPTRRIYEAVKSIPFGRVATYGQVAAMAGEPKMARAVGNALHKNPDPEHIPCYRVLNAKGELAAAFVFGGAGVQEALLRKEGIEVVNGKVDLKRFGIFSKE